MKDIAPYVGVSGLRIVHVCLASSYTEGLVYQDNMLADQNVMDGHEVCLVSDCSCFLEGRLVYAPPEDRFLESGVRLVRLAFDKIFFGGVSGKVRKSRALMTLVRDFSPDVILFHGVNSWELLNIAKYKQEHPHVKFYVDNHADANNSATNIISKIFLHGMLYRSILKRVYPVIDRIFYVSWDAKDFLVNNYKLPEDKMEFYPLGGRVYADCERLALRRSVRAELSLGDDDILLCHSGKLGPLKRTEDILRALANVQDDRFRLILLGAIPDDMRPVLEPLIAADGRVKYLGWMGADELIKYLCACDVYVQPGSQSATMQNALCCGAPVMLYPHKSHTAYMCANGWFVRDAEDIERVFREILTDPAQLVQMGRQSLALATELLDYGKLAARLYG